MSGLGAAIRAPAGLGQIGADDDIALGDRLESAIAERRAADAPYR